MSIHLLTRRPSRDAPETVLTGPISFAHGRLHELCGPARRMLAVLLAARLEGPVLWIRPAWQVDRVSADGLSPHLNPSRIVFVDVKRSEDALWCAEEALRSAAAPILIAELTEVPGLTPVRRLHLAGESMRRPSLPLLLSAGDGGAQGVETRWHMAPAHVPGKTTWTLSRLRARMAPPANWSLSMEAPEPGGAPVLKVA